VVRGGVAGLNMARHGATSATRPSAIRNPARLVHPGVRGHYEERRRQAGDGPGDAGQQVHARRQPIPRVQVDAHEDRFEEERDPLQREGQPHHLTVGAHQAGPEQPHLEAEDGARDGADPEQHAHGLDPLVRERAIVVIAGPDAAPLDEQHQYRHANAETGHDDVPAERQGHLLARREQLGRRRGRGDERYHHCHLSVLPQRCAPDNWPIIVRTDGQKQRNLLAFCFFTQVSS
jgi:hypothetical protein